MYGSVWRVSHASARRSVWVLCSQVVRRQKRESPTPRFLVRLRWLGTETRASAAVAVGVVVSATHSDRLAVVRVLEEIARAAGRATVGVEEGKLAKSFGVWANGSETGV